MKNFRNIIFSVSLQFLSGFTVAFLAGLLIYYKQKEYLHLGIILTIVFSIYYLVYQLRSKINVPNRAQVTSLAIVLLMSWFSPQFIYQIRPYTFYVSGFVIGAIVLITGATCLLKNEETVKFPYNFGITLLSFFVGYNIPWEVLNYLIVGLTILVVAQFFFQINQLLKFSLVSSFAIIIALFFAFSTPIVYHEEQANYEDKVVYAAPTRHHNLVITQWHQELWIFIDKLKNLSTIDEYLFYEPMAHSIFQVKQHINDVLVIGGENGCLLREILKHDRVRQIDVISYDTLWRKIGIEVEYFAKINQESYQHEKVHIIHEDLLDFISDSSKKYDAIFIDLPDPRSIETNQFYTLEFYTMISGLVREKGVMITQAGSPYFASQAYFSIGKTIENAGFNTLPIHNQILTLGEWGWYICTQAMERHEMKSRLINGDFPNIETKWYDEDAAKLISAFGKAYADTLNLGINTLDNPLVYNYYLKGNWELN